MGWVAMDFDGTLAKYEKWEGPTVIGDPVVPMVKLVQEKLAAGEEVRIFTARCWPITKPMNVAALLELRRSYEQDRHSVCIEFDAMPQRIEDAMAAIEAIHAWCVRVFGQALIVTCVKDYGLHELYDDRAVSVQRNTGATARAN